MAVHIKPRHKTDMRVWEIAQLANTESSVVINYMHFIGQPTKSASSSVPQLMALAIVSRLRKNPELVNTL